MDLTITTPTNPKNEDQDLKQLQQSLPKELWFNSYPMYLYQGCWNIILESTIACQNHFQAQDTDIFIASVPKTGTTWLKALLYSIVNRSTHELMHQNPHELVLQLESIVYANTKNPHLKNVKSPRLLGTHLPFQSLPLTIKHSKCKIVYICRNPFDTFISSWLFYLNYDENKSVKDDMIDEYFGKFCDGKFPFGPFEDHLMGYWKKSLENDGKVLFIKFEDLKMDFEGQMRKLASFVGYPFTKEEEEKGVVDEIREVCSIERMKEVEANKSGRVYSFIENKWFFRKGEVGDWVNYLSNDLVERFEKIMEEKFEGSGLKF